MAYSLGDIGNFLVHVALFAFGFVHTLPYLVVTYTDDRGLRQFLADTLNSLVYCIQPLAGQDRCSQSFCCSRVLLSTGDFC
jgi:hypothetical protein